MATRVLTRKEAAALGLIPREGDGVMRTRRTNRHVEEIARRVKGARPGQLLVYEPRDGKSYQTQVLRVRQAFDSLGRPWPLTRPVDGGKATVIRILARAKSLDQYPQQPLASRERTAAPRRDGR